MFAATAVLNLTMAVYHRVMSGSLGLAYAELTAVINAANILLVFTGGVSTSLAKAFAADAAIAGGAGVRARLGRVFRPLLVSVAGGALALALAAPLVVGYLRLPGRGIYLLTVALVAVAFCVTALRAALQGLHRFGWLSLSLMSEGIFRVGLGAALVLAAGGGAAAALAASLGASLMAAAFLVPPLRALPAQAPGAALAPSKVGWREAGVDTLALGLFSLLCYLDLFVVKHHAEAAFAADYSRIQMVGKSFLYAGSALVMVLLPSVARLRAAGGDPRGLLLKFLGAHALLLGLGYAVLAGFTPWVIRVLCGSQAEFQAYAPDIRLFCVAVIPLALFQLVLLYHLGMGEHRVLWLIAVAAAGYFGALEAFHASTAQVAACLGGASLLALAASLALAARRPAPKGGLGPEEGLAVALQEIGD